MLKCNKCNKEIKGFMKNDSVSMSESILLTACPYCKAPMKYDKFKKEIVMITNKNFKQEIMKAIDSAENIDPAVAKALRDVINMLDDTLTSDSKDKERMLLESLFESMFAADNKEEEKEEEEEEDNDLFSILSKLSENCDCPSCKPDFDEEDDEDEIDPFVESVIEGEYLVVYRDGDIVDMTVMPNKSACEEFLNDLEEDGCDIIKAVKLEPIKVKAEIKHTLTIVE